MTKRLGVYDTIEEFNVDSKAECDQLNLAHVLRWCNGNYRHVIHCNTCNPWMEGEKLQRPSRDNCRLNL